MAFSKTHVGIAVGAGSLLVAIFVGYFWWLSNQPPVLARSEDHDPLTGLPVSIKMNPLRDRSTEHAANNFLREIRDGHCDDLLNKWSMTTTKNTRTSSANPKPSTRCSRGSWWIGK